MIGKRSYSKVEWIFEHDPALWSTIPCSCKQKKKCKKCDNTGKVKNPDFSYEDFEKTTDRKHLPLRKGCEPTVYTVRQLTRKQFVSVTSQFNLSEMMDEAIRYGLVAVKNFKLDGKDVVLDREDTDLGKAVTEESFDKVFTQDTFSALGAFIMQLSRLDPLSQGA